MDDWVVLATGPSMSQKLADSLKGRNAVVVSDAFRLAPWAYALVSQDKAWWEANPDAMEFAGRKISTQNVEGVDKFRGTDWHQLISSGTNSGLVACCFAQAQGAKRIEMYGFDMHGTHYFGKHKEPLKNTTEQRFKVMIAQFQRWRPPGIEVINMTPGSAIPFYPFGV